MKEEKMLSYTQAFLIIPFFANDAVKIIGIIVIGIGLLIEILGMISLGENFRIYLPREKTKLVTTGIYRYIRNPLVLSNIYARIWYFFDYSKFTHAIGIHLQHLCVPEENEGRRKILCWRIFPKDKKEEIEMITLKDSIEIKIAPERIFDWFKNLDKNFTEWHPK